MPTKEVMDHERRKTMLAPSAYDEALMPSLRLARTSRTVRKIAKVLFGLMVLSIGIMAIAPWQQSIPGKGNVIAYAPLDRQQVIEAPIKGRIKSWGEGIVENALVEKGQIIAVIRDLDENYSERLDEQLKNSRLSVFAAQQQLLGKTNALVATKMILNAYEAQLESSKSFKTEILAAADEYITMAKQKVQAEEQKLREYNAAIPQLELDYERHKILYEENNVSGLKFQQVTRKLEESRAKVDQAIAYVAAAKSELAGKIREREAKSQEAQLKIDDVEAKLRKTDSDVEKLNSDIAKTEQELNKAKNEVLKSENAVARQSPGVVRAPLAGFIVKIGANQGTQVLKQGDPLCTIVPDTKDRAVQIWLSGNDAPLIEPGRHVRLQFEGWPAMQFSGWPSVAVGTFGGTIASVDATDDGKGKFRALVLPDDDDSWPPERFLRQGVRANGWVLLDQVPLWYEVWRNLNAFPPVVDVNDKQLEKTKTKPPKLPK